MPRAPEQLLASALCDGRCEIGEVAVSHLAENRFFIAHREDVERPDLRVYHSAEDAIALARFDDQGKFRPLKTAPSLRHGWRIELSDLRAVARAIEYFYPGRLAVLVSVTHDELSTTALRQTLQRQTGMYRVAARISDAQIEDVVTRVCRTDGGCLRTILWRRDASGAVPSSRLPDEKYEAASPAPGSLPLLCQEACAVLINQCRVAVKADDA